jgi:multidrug resistance efflux pump
MPNSHRASNTARSEDVSEILSTLPGRFIRWGTTVIASLFLLMIVSTWFIKYPDIIRSTVTLTTSQSPVTLVSRNAGEIILPDPNIELVKKNDIIAYIHSDAEFEDVLRIEKEVGGIAFQPGSSCKLGMLQSFYTSFLRARSEYRIFQENQVYHKQVQQLTGQINSYLEMDNVMKAQRDLMTQELALAHRKFERDSLLFAASVISQLSYNDAQSAYLKSKQDFQTMQKSIIENNVRINQIQREIALLEGEYAEKSKGLLLALENVKNELLAEISKWKNDYLFITPIDGTLVHLKFLENHSHINANENVFTIISSSKHLYAQGELPVKGSGKVNVGQRAIIKVDDFPYEEYGMLEGKITKLSLVPAGNNYLIKIEMENGLTTTYHKDLPFKQQFTGEAEIITDNLSLLERIFFSFRSLLRTS